MDRGSVDKEKVKVCRGEAKNVIFCIVVWTIYLMLDQVQGCTICSQLFTPVKKNKRASS